MYFNPELITVGAIGGMKVADSIVAVLFFLLLLFILKKIAWGPLVKVMEERENFVANEIDSAEQNRKEAEVALQKANEQLQQTRAESQQMIEDARAMGIQQEEEIVKAAHTEAERIKKAAQEEIRNEKERAIKALQDQVASLSVLVASKVIEKEVSEQDHDSLIADYIKEVGEEQ